MSQFQRAVNVSREVTGLLPEKIAQYALGKNLGGSFRVVSVADSITTTKGGKQNYGIVIAMSDGIADLTSWDAGAHQEWLRLASHGKGAMVHIQGMSCTKRSPLVQGFANGEWVFNVNKDTYKVDVLHGLEDNSIPVNGKVPPSWLPSFSCSSFLAVVVVERVSTCDGCDGWWRTMLQCPPSRDVSDHWEPTHSSLRHVSPSDRPESAVLQPADEPH